ncbi:hypothetical protein N7526_004568 [Penicillium atrosanguineum]|nr:hypothetical protein N7526_004568 [Penicillium atrosanguineum]
MGVEGRVKAVSGQLLNAFPKKEDLKTAFKFIRLLFSLNYTTVDVVLITVGTFFAIAAGIPEPLLGVVLGQLINELNEVACSATVYNSSSVLTKVLYLIYITIFNFASIYIYASCWALVSERLARRYRKAYFRSVIRQEAAFHDTLPSGQVISRLVSDIETLQSGTSEKVGIYIATVSYFVTAYTVAFCKVPVIAGILVAAIPCLFAMAMIGGHFASRYGTRVGINVDSATSIALSSLSHMKIVHAFNAQRRLEELFSFHLSRSRKGALKKAAVHAGQMGTLFFIVYSSNALAYWKGAHLIADSIDVLNSGVSVGAVYTVIFILIDATFIFSQVSPYMHVFSAATSASGRFLEVIQRDSNIDGTSSEGERNANLEDHDIYFKEVHFKYPARPETPILQGLSFSIPAKQHTAIVGPSGGGKSTIVALLERFYDPLEGKIFIGEQDIQNVNLASLRGQMGFVQQESQLMNRSILENIAYGLVGSVRHKHLAEVILNMSLTAFVAKVQSGCSEEQALADCDVRIAEVVQLAKAAAERANALGFIQALEFRISSQVGMAGGQLSGGQRQRIALATALVREPKMLILDEATAALDSMSEQLIQSALLNLSETTTIVSIAHRLATVKDADQIVVIQNGQLVERGSPQMLLKRGGAYATMISQQKVNNANNDLSISMSVDTEGNSISTDPNQIRTKEMTLEGKRNAILDSENVSAEKEMESTTFPSKTEDATSISNWLAAKSCFAFIRPNVLLIVLGLFMSVIIGASYSSNAILFGNTVGGLSPCKSTANIRHSGNLYGLMFFVVGLVECFANVIGGCAYGWAADQVLYRTRVASLRSLLSQNITWHSSEGRSPGTLVAYITGDASALSGITGTTIGLLLTTAVNLLAGVVISFVVAWKISIVLVPTIPILLFAGVMKLRTQSQFAERHKKTFSKATEITVEALGNLRFVTGFSLEHQLFKEFLESMQKPYQDTNEAIAWGNFWLASAFSVSNLISALAYWWGSKQIASGLYPQTQFFIVLPALLFSTQSCGQMLALAPDLSKAGKATSRIVDLVNTNSAEETLENNKYLRFSKTEMALVSDVEANGHPVSTSTRNKYVCSGVSAALHQVKFSYPSSPDIPALKGMSITFKPGGYYALVGPSGSGKSTIFSMLERFYYPSSGSIFINDQNITRIVSTDFRDGIALVPQENALFEGTVAFNIALGARPGYKPTQAEIEEACKLAHIHDVITALPDKYETLCTRDGKQFSGGQRQHLSIARALVRGPSLLLLDESTSALDGESEQKIQDALSGFAGKMTVIAIAHRLRTIYRADQIFLIKDGCCVDHGTHSQLVERSEMYREAVRHQSFD